MYHSVLIDTSSASMFQHNYSVNTYDDWFLIPDSRPTIVNPSVQTSYIDVPGASGSIDASDWLTGFPTYADREGDLVFFVENDHGNWTDRRNEINAKVHGRKVKLMLEDEMDYFYKGRLQVNDWSSEANWSKLTLKYRLEPFKYAINGTYLWRWNPFNFNSGIIHESEYSGISASSGTKYITGKHLPIQPSYGTIYTKDSNESGLQVRFVNSELGIDMTAVTRNGKTVIPEMLFSNLTGTNLVSISALGVGTVSFDVVFRSI